MGSDPQQLDALQSLEADAPAPNVAQPESYQPAGSQASISQAASEPAVSSISLEAEVPELLYEGMRQFITSHPQWDQYRLVTSALANFLFQNGCSDQTVTKHYLNSLFLKP